MTGNLLFIGLGVAQGNGGLLIRALVAVLVFLVGVTFGAFCLERAPQQQTRTAWHNTFVRYLLMEWLLLLVYAIVWRVTSNLSQQGGVQILLLCVAALGMGIQGALVMAVKIPGVVADALTATLITLGQRIAQGLGHPGPESQEWRWSSIFRALLCLIYAVMAASQRGAALATLGEPSGVPAWQTIPSWYMVANHDNAIPPALERFMAARMHAHTVQINSSHAAMVSHPAAVTDLILSAAQGD